MTNRPPAPVAAPVRRPSRPASGVGAPGRLEGLCQAPDLQLYFRPDGVVGACCRSSQPYGNVQTTRLRDLWEGASRARLSAGLAAGRFPTGCERCATESHLGARQDVYAAEFDHWARRLGAPLDADVEPSWPLRMEFNLSNRCNLQCIQCTGDLSSAIRLHREKRAPMPAAYGDEFFEDLRPFLPHLRHAAFAGGEPFLTPENFRVWDLLRELNPGLPCTIITNGTQWNRRVEAVLESFEVEPVVSIDGFTAGTFEAIRIGGDHAQVMANTRRFAAYARDRGTAMSVNTCVMVQNLHELPDLVAWAEGEQVRINALTVHGPPEVALAQLSRPDLAARLEELETASAALGELSVNADVLVGVAAQMRSWLGPAGAGSNATAWTEQVPSILQFRRHGAGPLDDETARAALSLWSGGPVHQVTIGLDERTHGWPPALLERLGADAANLEGQPLGSVLALSSRLEVLAEEEDRYEAQLTVGPGPVRVMMVPVRDADGRCDEVHALFAFPGVSPVAGES